MLPSIPSLPALSLSKVEGQAKRRLRGWAFSWEVWRANALWVSLQNPFFPLAVAAVAATASGKRAILGRPVPSGRRP